MGFKKDVERLRQWASGATKKLEDAPAQGPAANEPAVDPAFDKGCAGKEAYASKKAVDAAQLYREQQGVPSQGMVAYYCRFCRNWHLGHSRHSGRANPKSK